MDKDKLLQKAVSSNASDLHILVGYPPILRINGELVNVGDDKVSSEQAKEIIFKLLNQQQKDLFLVNKELDFSFEFGGKARFRINVYFEKGNPAASLRLLPRKIKTIEELNLPQICHRFSKLKRGFVLVAGPTGHGKSTTLAAVIEEINKNRSEHILTIEDPIEYIYEGVQSIISQREIHHDTHSWPVALRSALREDPDVVLIGEMRDHETIAAALTVAETGHLVFSTLHTNSAAQTIDRIVDVFPDKQQIQIRMQLANVLEGVVSQRLIPAIGGGLIPVVEILLATPAVRNTIREGKTHLIDNIIQTSQELGMVSLEKSLADWVNKGKLELSVAEEWSIRPENLSRLLRMGKRK